MGMLVEGEWKTDGLPRDREARFARSTTTFRDRVTAGGSSGLPAQAGRYHLYISWAVSLSSVEPFMSDDGWAFSNGSGASPIHCMARGFARDLQQGRRLLIDLSTPHGREDQPG